MMTPQLFINYKLKSVAHLPWRMMTYKALNTFIDDIFAFVIKMPTMYRLGCFRDDIVFFIFLYQKYVYRVSVSKQSRVDLISDFNLFYRWIIVESMNLVSQGTCWMKCKITKMHHHQQLKQRMMSQRKKTSLYLHT